MIHGLENVSIICIWCACRDCSKGASYFYSHLPNSVVSLSGILSLIGCTFSRSGGTHEAREEGGDISNFRGLFCTSLPSSDAPLGILQGWARVASPQDALLHNEALQRGSRPRCAPFSHDAAAGHGRCQGHGCLSLQGSQALPQGQHLLGLSVVSHWVKGGLKLTDQRVWLINENPETSE